MTGLTRGAADAGSGAQPTLRSLGGTVYLPTLLFAVGQGAVLPIAALAARDLGASLPMVGVIVALRGLGTLAFDLPAGSLVGRWGERRAMLVGTALLTLSLVGCVAATEPLLFGASMFLMGCGWSIWLLSRLAYVSDVMPVHMRGRALSTLGGTHRIGSFIGPFLGAVAISLSGFDGAFYVHLVLAVVGWAVLAATPDPYAAPDATAAHGTVPFAAVVRAHRRTFLTAGVATTAVGILRAARHVVLPLWADRIGIDAAGVAVIFGVSAAVEVALFYPTGTLMDRVGRKAAGVPCLLLLAAGQVLVPLTDSYATLLAVGVIMGVGNGFGAGIVMTLGADFSPARGRAEFLGVWRLVGDVGTSGGPLLVAGVGAVASLATATVVVGLLGVAGALVLALLVPEPLHRASAPVDDDVGADAGDLVTP